jgi:hypothetical protein
VATDDEMKDSAPISYCLLESEYESPFRENLIAHVVVFTASANSQFAHGNQRFERNRSYSDEDRIYRSRQIATARLQTERFHVILMF